MSGRNVQNKLPLPVSLRVYSSITLALTYIAFAVKPLLAGYGGFRDTVPERLGKFSPELEEFSKTSGSRKVVWIHAVSVGEAAVAKVLVDSIRSRNPEVQIAISTTTFTGRDYIRRNFEPDLLFFYPLDLPGPMRNLVHKLKPTCFVDIEVELWPNCFRALVDAGVPMALANGRISDRAADPPGLMKALYRWLLGSMDRLFMRSEKDVERVIALGAPRNKTVLAGNLKFAACGHPPDAAVRNNTRALLGVNDKSILLVCGSTHPGEDEQLLDAWNNLREQLDQPVHLVLAPRHLEQVDRIISLVSESGENAVKWTEITRSGRIDENVQVVVIDTIGELMGLYAAADVAFVGGSLIAKGGHNVLEPVAMGIPTLHGPSMANFHDLKEVLSGAGLITEVANSGELVNECLKILETNDRVDFIEQSRKLIDSQQKASDLIADWVVEKLGQMPDNNYTQD